MIRQLFAVAVSCFASIAGTARAETPAPASAAPVGGSLHAWKMRDIDGKEVSLDRYRGKVVLVVNVASKCGLTPQYEALQKLHDKYGPAGFAIAGFPANNFRGQEPGDEAQIKAFCKTKYDVKFDLYSKISVKGEDQHPLYQWITAGAGREDLKGEVSWNFEKFLFDVDGKPIARFAPKTKPDDAKLVAAIEKGLTAVPAPAQPGKDKPTGDKPAAQPAVKTPAALGFVVKDITGKDHDLAQHAGKVVMIVNVASDCGATPQYKNLQALHDKYAPQGLVILGFPANNFGGQEPGSDAEIQHFCKTKFAVKFPMMSKLSVAGDDQHPLFKLLTGHPRQGGAIKWNFEKFLLGRDGEPVAHFRTDVNPEDPQVVQAVERELKKKLSRGPTPG